MQKGNLQRGAAGLLLVFLAIAVGVLAGVYYYANKFVNLETVDTGDVLVVPPQDHDRRVAMPQMLLVPMREQNNSKENGMAKITTQDGKVVVEISVANGPKDAPQPAHIHLGSCQELGDVKKPLTSLVNGTSRTIVEDMSLADILNGLPMAINVHQSADKLNVYTSCGDIVYIPPSDTGEPMGGMSQGRIYQSSDTKECARMLYMCVAGYEAFSDESGCGCQLKTGEGAMGSVTPPMTPGMMSSDARVVKITAKDYAFSAKEIRVKKGEKVRLNLTVESGAKTIHDWVVDGLAKTSQIQADESTSVEFTPDTAGTFEYYCSVGSHRQMGMRGTLIVE
jgi:plastocyanin